MNLAFSGRTASALSVLLILNACTTVPEDSGFSEVSDAVRERLGKRVHWYQGAPEDQQVADSLRTLLASPLNPHKAVQIALLNNRRLQAVYERLGIAQANLVQAGLLQNPVFHGALLYASGAGGKPDLDLGIVQNFMNIFTLPLRRQVAESQFAATKLEVTLAAMALAGEVLDACYRLQAAEQTLELLQEVHAGVTASLDAAQQLHDAGNITDLDLHNEQILFHETKLELAAAELAVWDAREQLNALMGLWGENTQWQFADRLPDVPEQAVDLTEVEKRALAKSLDLAIVRANMDTAARQSGLTDATRFLPELELGISAEREESEWERGPSFGFGLPLFDQGQARQRVSNAELRRLREEYAALAVEIRAAARRASLSLRLARDRALYLRKVVMPLRGRILSESLLNYNAMQLGVFELLQAQRQQVLSARQYLEALRDYWLARARFEQLLSGRLPSISMDAVAAGLGTALATGEGAEAGH